MPDSEAVEVQVVFKDGTVDRISGSGVGEWWREAVKHNGECGFDNVEWTTTKPLRKIICGVGHYAPGCDEVGTLRLRRTRKSHMEYDFDGALLPVECRDHGTYNFRITVEAVEEEGR